MTLNASYMLDTNVFNHICKGVISLEIFDGKHLLATPLQIIELKNTKDPILLTKLLATFNEIAASEVPAAFSFDIEGAGWDQGVLSGNADCAHAAFADLKHLDQLKPNSKWSKNLSPEKENRKMVGAWNDILTAEAAKRNGAILITEDRNLLVVARKYGVLACSPKSLV